MQYIHKILHLGSASFARVFKSCQKSVRNVMIKIKMHIRRVIKNTKNFWKK